MTNSTKKFLLSIIVILIVFCFSLFHGNPTLKNEKRGAETLKAISPAVILTEDKTSESDNREILTSQNHDIQNSKETLRSINKNDIEEAFDYVNSGYEGPDDNDLIDTVFEQFRETDISEEGMEAWITAVFPEDEDIEEPIELPPAAENEIIQEEMPTQDEFQEAFFKELLKSDLPEDQAQALAHDMFSSDETETEIDLESLVEKYSGEVILIVDILRNSGVPPEEMEAAIEEVLGH